MLNWDGSGGSKMKHHEERIVRYDSTLKIEALRLKGIIQKFPNDSQSQGSRHEDEGSKN
jgi:hypothetical protein